MKVAIVIPTINRPEFMARQLRFYNNLNCEHPIYIGDSSCEEISKAFQEQLKREFTNLEIYYFHVPELNDGQTVHHLISNVKEEYTVFIGDDDFQIPAVLSECSEYLEKNPQYNIVSGRGLLFSLDSEEGIEGNLNLITNYKVPNIEDESGKDRLLKLFKNYSPTHFGVHRTKQFLDAYDNLLEIPDKRFRELLPAAMDVIKGKNKVLPEVQFLRQHHDGRYFLPSLFKWVANSGWHESLEKLTKSIVEEIKKSDNLNDEQASEVASEAIENYFYIRVLLTSLPNRKQRVITCIKKKLPSFVLKYYRNWKLSRAKDEILKSNSKNPQLGTLLKYIESTK